MVQMPQVDRFTPTNKIGGSITTHGEAPLVCTSLFHRKQWRITSSRCRRHGVDQLYGHEQWRYPTGVLNGMLVANGHEQTGGSITTREAHGIAINGSTATNKIEVHTAW